ncbi:MAG: ABC transporter substrate-binding protein [Burkholderiales bacterium]
MHAAGRRRLLIAACAALATGSGRAQQRRAGHIAILHTTPAFSAAFRARLRELGYVEGQNLRIDEGLDVATPQVLERLPGAATEAASEGVDLIFAGGGELTVKAIQRGAPNTPLVMLFVDVDPVARGIVASLSRPGGNVTGVYSHHIELAAKRLQILREAVPSTRRMAVLYDASSRDQFKSAQDAASAISLTLIPQELRGSTYDVDGALRDASRQGADSLLILSSAQFFPHRATIARTALALRLPSAGNPTFAEMGALLGYGPTLPGMFAQGAEIADRILRGTKPADIPIQQADRIELVVNRTTANALGVSMPRSLLDRADRILNASLGGGQAPRELERRATDDA